MANLHKEKRNGKTYYRIQFYDKNNDRRAIRLGRLNKKDADVIRVKVEALVSASISGAPLDNQTSEWIANLGDDLAKKLANVKLITRRKTSTLAGFLEDLISLRLHAGDLKHARTVRIEIVL